MIRTVRPATAVGRVRAPASKSYTHRALVLAGLRPHRTRLHRPLDSDDTRATARGLQAMGALIERGGESWFVRGPESVAAARTRIDCGESGTTLRFLTAVAALGPGPTCFAGSGRLPDRPMGALHDALGALGARIERASELRAIPAVVRGPIHAGSVELDTRDSSQPLSALLLTLPFLAGPSRIHLRGRRVSRPYVAASLTILRRAGVRIRSLRSGYAIAGGQEAAAERFDIPGDASSAAYLWAAAAATGGAVSVTGIDRSWPQADLLLLEILDRMGCRIDAGPRAVRVQGAPGAGIDVNLSDAPDLLPLVAALASLVPGRISRLRGVGRTRHKESDRLLGSTMFARALGARATLREGTLEIVGTERVRPLRWTAETDHRMVMSAAVAALAAPGPSRIGDARAVAKSFPGFWPALASLTRGNEEPR